MVGHSLGGAVASILAINLDIDGYKVGGVTTFGQPKFTDKVGMEKYKHIPITRVVNEKDVVPLVRTSRPRFLHCPAFIGIWVKKSFCSRVISTVALAQKKAWRGG